jgi:hypothetical protein
MVGEVFRSTFTALGSLAALYCLLGCLAGCLPGDLRPEPAEVYMRAGPTGETQQGFATADGWQVRFERFVTGLGDVRVNDDPDGPRGSCNGYSETHYEWLYDFTVAQDEKVGLAYGLGTCSIEFRFREPSDDAILGAGASQADFQLMRKRGSDSYADDERGVVLAIGEGSRGGVVKRFEWIFRRSYELKECPDGAGGSLTVRELAGGDALDLPIVVRGEELFRKSPDDEAPYLFDRFAAADVDADGVITIAELSEVEVPAEDLGVEALEGLPEDVMPTLADLVYTLLLPRIARLAGGGACEAELRDRRR